MEKLEFKGTKGEWILSKEIRQNEHSVRYATIDHDGAVDCAFIFADERKDDSLEVLISDSKLIVAAPDLLEALIKLTSNAGLQKYVSDNEGTLLSESFNKAKQAIEKALK